MSKVWLLIATVYATFEWGPLIGLAAIAFHIFGILTLDWWTEREYRREWGG